MKAGRRQAKEKINLSVIEKHDKAIGTDTDPETVRLADRAWHQCASPVDLPVAVSASHHNLTVLHADSDFETIATHH